MRWNADACPALQGMPRYFFHARNLKHASTDPVGEDLADDEAAWREATLVTAELIRDIDGKFRPGEQWSLEVNDQRQMPVYVIRVITEKK